MATTTAELATEIAKINEVVGSWELQNTALYYSNVAQDVTVKGIDQSTGNVKDMVIPNLAKARLALPRPVSSTVTVGTTGDYASITEALAYLSTLTPVHTIPEVVVEIELQAGFVMNEQVLVRGIDLGWIKITGVDERTVCATSALVEDFTLVDYGTSTKPLFGVSKGGVLPQISQMFKLDTVNNSNTVGVVVAGNSTSVISSGCGVTSAGIGLYAMVSSVVYADRSVFDLAVEASFMASSNSTIYANNVIVDNSSQDLKLGTAFDLSGGSVIEATRAFVKQVNRGCTIYSGSTINIGFAQFEKSYSFIEGYGCTVFASSVKVTEIDSTAVILWGLAMANFYDSTFQGISGNVLYINGSIINADKMICDTDSSFVNIVPSGAATINVNGSTATTSQALNTLTSNGIIYG
jgi:hypothetical protein